MYQRTAWLQHTSACFLVPTGFKTSVVSAWGTAEREALMEMMGSCHWAHSTVGSGIREQGNSSTGGQWAGCPYQWGWRSSCRRDMKTQDPWMPQIQNADAGKSQARSLQANSRQLMELQLPLQSIQWERRGWQRVDSEVATGHAASPRHALCCHPSSASHLHPASDPHWLPPDPHLSGARLSCLTDSPVPCLA